MSTPTPATPRPVLRSARRARRRRALRGIAGAVSSDALARMSHALAGAPGIPTACLNNTPFAEYLAPRVYAGAVVGARRPAAAYAMVPHQSRVGVAALGSHVPKSPAGAAPTSACAAVDLYWLPLGAGGHSVRFNGLVFEAIAARLHHRTRCDLYHSALEVRLGSDRYVIEMAPVWNEHASDRGVVGEGAVASRRLGRLRMFRYEIRRWRAGRIPDIAAAVDSPQRLTEDPSVARRVLELVPSVPTLVWGRDELNSGDMWNSNSVSAWLLVHAGIDVGLVDLPAGGRAPGWTAGIAVARLAPARTVINTRRPLPPVITRAARAARSGSPRGR